jgi:hypothetical protein
MGVDEFGLPVYGDLNCYGEVNTLDIEAFTLALTYARSGELWLAVWGEYDVDGNGDYVADSYEAVSAREFRYDGGRARYLVRDIDTNQGDPDPGNWPLGDAVWTDYNCDIPLTDYTAVESQSEVAIDTDNERPAYVVAIVRILIDDAKDGDVEATLLPTFTH